jgi:ubiquinone/menaquinone biosynthesis C-methylase UbiE/ADP-ribose pyrophosphatase YjhB (NUDIX family)
VTHPTILSAALFERDDRVLTAHRKEDRPPFAGQWLLPLTPLRPIETAEDAVRRYAREQFGVEVAREAFVETVYMADPDGEAQYVANIFRAEFGGGPMRFRADGDHDDARWLSSTEIAQLWMPPALRDRLVQIMTDPNYAPDSDWSAKAPSQGAPLGERYDAFPTEAKPTPDNRAAWDTIAKAYQEERYGDRFGSRLMWSWRASEDDLHVLGEVSRKRVLVLGCGGGQDVVALCKLGAVVVGIDASAPQLAYARKHAAKHDAANAAFVEGTVEDLSRFDSASFDVVVSIHALDFVDDLAAVLTGAARVLKDNGVLATAVKHPFDVRVDGEGAPPYRVWASYWTREYDWSWKFKSAEAEFRSYLRTMGEWFDAITSAGFTVERLIEPKEDQLPKVEGDVLDDRWLGLMPFTLIIQARKN